MKKQRHEEDRRAEKPGVHATDSRAQSQSQGTRTRVQDAETRTERQSEGRGNGGGERSGRGGGNAQQADKHGKSGGAGSSRRGGRAHAKEGGKGPGGAAAGGPDPRNPRRAPTYPQSTPRRAPVDSRTAPGPSTSRTASRVKHTIIFYLMFTFINVRVCLQGGAHQASHCSAAGVAQTQSGLSRDKQGRACPQVPSTRRAALAAAGY